MEMPEILDNSQNKNIDDTNYTSCESKVVSNETVNKEIGSPFLNNVELQREYELTQSSYSDSQDIFRDYEPMEIREIFDNRQNKNIDNGNDTSSKVVSNEKVNKEIVCPFSNNIELQRKNKLTQSSYSVFQDISRDSIPM